MARALRGGYRSRGEAECIASTKVNVDYAMKETPAKWRTPVSQARRLN
jgi:hypothetical protein